MTVHRSILAASADFPGELMDARPLIAIDTAALPWEERFNEKLGRAIFRKNLITDPDTGMEVRLVRYPAGVINVRHTHPCAHGMYVLEGTLVTHAGRYGPGCFVWFPEGTVMEHGASADGDVTVSSSPTNRSRSITSDSSPSGPECLLEETIHVLVVESAASMSDGPRPDVLPLRCACGKNRVTKANYDKVEKGMSLGEVEAILGRGERETGDGSNIAAGPGVDVNMGEARLSPGTTYFWETKGKKITLVFIGDKVFSKVESGL